ncbi:MAG: hypothetical protein O2971_00290 [Proteobacteria bacterium]|nr:hypothetical protein [Pseudomonadota bacterium]
MHTLTCANLVSMGRHVPVPFNLAVAEELGQETLNIDAILRIVPGRRLIGVSTWRGTPVIVKLFYQPQRWKRHLLRDISGINQLRQRHIRTPAILHQTNTSDQRGAVLIIDYLQQGASLGSLFEAADEHSNAEQRDSIMQRALSTIGQCHRLGIWQNDMHLDNFMLDNEQVFLLDGGTVEAVDDALDIDTALSNLALFFAQFPVSEDSRLQHWLEFYQRHGVVLPMLEASRIGERVDKARKIRLANFEKKLFRSTTANRCIQQSSRFVVYDRAIHSDELTQFIENPDSYIAESNIIKAGNTSTVAQITIGNRDYVLKRYNIKNFWHGIIRLLQPSRAYHSWRNAWVLEMLGIATPHPCLMLEERLLWILRRRAYFLMAKVGGENLLDQLDSSSEVNSDIESITAAFQKLFQVFNQYLISHGDMKATNFIFSNQTLYVLDLDAMRRHRSRPEFDNARAKDLSRFARNWAGGALESRFRNVSREE